MLKEYLAGLKKAIPARRSEEATQAWLEYLKIKQEMDSKEQIAHSQKLKEIESRMLELTILDCKDWKIPALSFQERLNNLTPKG